MIKTLVAMIFLILVVPIITVWALTTLFPILRIELTFATYFATMWFFVIFGAVKLHFKK